MNIRGGWSMIIVFDSVCMLSLSKKQSRRSEVSFCNWIIFVCATHGMLKLNHLYLRIWLYWLLSECFLLLLPLKKLLVRSCFAWLVISYKGSFRNMNTVQKTCFKFYFFLVATLPGWFHMGISRNPSLFLVYVMNTICVHHFSSLLSRTQFKRDDVEPENECMKLWILFF